MVPAAERRRRLYATLTGLLIGGVVVAATLTASPDTSATLAQARAQLAVCRAELDTATTSAAKTRARACIADLQRVIAALQPTPAPTTPAPVPTSPGGLAWPTELTAGVPSGWVPKTTKTGDWRITASGVYEDVRVDGSIQVDAADVTLRRVLVVGGTVDNQPGSTCRNGLTLEQVTVRRGQTTRDSDPPAIGMGGYTARSVALLDVPEGFRVGGKDEGCGPVSIEDSYVRVVSPDVCSDWHGDGVQGYYGAALTVHNVTVDMQESDECGGTAPFFYPRDQGNTSASVDRLLVKGGGFPFRDGMPGTVRGLAIVDGSWGWGPLDVRCSVITSWEASIVRLDSAGQVTSTVRSQACDTEAGS